MSTMNERFPHYYGRGLRWCVQVEETIVRLRIHPPHQGALIAIINAIEFQFEEEAEPETLRLLIGALLQFARTCGLASDAIGLPATAEAIIEGLRPAKGSKTR